MDGPRAFADIFGDFLVPKKLGNNSLILRKLAQFWENSAFFVPNWETLPFKFGFFC